MAFVKTVEKIFEKTITHDETKTVAEKVKLIRVSMDINYINKQHRKAPSFKRKNIRTEFELESWIFDMARELCETHLYYIRHAHGGKMKMEYPSYVLHKDVIHIKVPHLLDPNDEQVIEYKKKLHMMPKRNKIIIDLINNVGGYFIGMNDAVQNYLKQIKSPRVIVAVNFKTASAAEMVAAILSRKYPIVGERTSGAATNIYDVHFKDGSMLKMPADNFTYDGMIFKNKYIEPDIHAENPIDVALKIFKEIK
jgi:C-terminal processing protease CtpA/Prc